MQEKLLKVLACPACHGELSCHTTQTATDGEIITGVLKCDDCQITYPIEDGIPRFTARDNYASSFGYQWNRFKAEQIDSISQTGLSEKRFYSETGWTKEWMSGKWILDAGCGAGRFLDVASRADCDVVGLDLSNAVDAAKNTLAGRKNVHLVQASIYQLPFRDGAFDGCYCIGVIQHTPDPQGALRSLPRVLREKGRLAVTIYERKKWTLFYAKYLIRWATKRMNQRALLLVLKVLLPVLFPLTEVLFRIPYLKRLFIFTIPVANYVDEPALSLRQRYQWALLDTFDMLAPQYDQPQTQQEVEQALKTAQVSGLSRLSNPGLNVIGYKG